jgi:predicted RNA binding protein YcfA (HicA-like mRNA interferase family)
MVKPAKLYEKLRQSPSQLVAFRDFERLLVAFGFLLQRTRGSHRAYKHPDVPELLTVQPKGKDAKPYQIRKFLDMMEQFGLELDE